MDPSSSQGARAKSKEATRPEENPVRHHSEVGLCSGGRRSLQAFRVRGEKRGRDALEEHPPQQGQHPISLQEGPASSFKVLASDDDCGAFLGRNGEHKRRLQDELGVEIKVSNRTGDSGKVEWRCISVSASGQRETELEAVSRISQFIGSRTAKPRADNFTVHFLYDRSMLDAICRGRHSIRELAQEHRVNMRVDSGAGVACANSCEDVLMIQGDAARVQQAARTCAELAWDNGRAMGPAPARKPAPEPPIRQFSMNAYSVVDQPFAPPASRPATFVALTPVQQQQLMQHQQALVQQALLQQQVLDQLSQPVDPFSVKQSALEYAARVAATELMMRASSQRPEAGRRSPGREAAQVKFRLVVSQAEASFLLEREEPAPVCRLQALRNDAKREGCHVRLHDNKDSGPKHPMRCLEITSPPASSQQGLSAAWPTLQALIQVLLNKEQPLEAASFTLVLPKNGQAGSFIGKNGSDVEQLRAELGPEVEIKIANDVSLLVPMLGGKLPEGVAASDEGVKIEGKPALVLSALSTIALKLLAYQEKYPGGRSNASASKGTTPRGSPVPRMPRVSPHGSPLLLPSPEAERPAKRQRFSASELQTTETMLLTPDEKRVVMGPGGSNLQTLREIFKPVTLKLHDMPTQDGLRQLDITGPADRVRSAKDYIEYQARKGLEHGLEHKPGPQPADAAPQPQA